MDDEPSFGRWLKRRRRALGLTQEDLAEQVGCSVQTIRKIEGDARRPSQQITALLAKALDLAPTRRADFMRAARTGADPDLPGAPSAPAAATPDAEPRATSSAAGSPARTVTMLFTDIEGSTRLWEQHPREMAHALARHDAILRDSIESHGGMIFRTVGDAFCAVFAEALDAVVAALVAQRALAAEPWGATGPLRVRMALHTDAVETRDDGDYQGLALSRVARLLAAGHGGQTLLSRTTRDMVAGKLAPELRLDDLGSYRLKDLSRPEQIFQLIAADLPSKFPPLVTLEGQPARLPLPSAPLIGRDTELADLTRHLADPACRLITVVGPGGIGKTRLALQVAADHAERFVHGAHFVPLAPVASAAALPSAIADALGFAFYGAADPATQLLGYLHEKELLLVLDNLEHLLDAADLLVTILERAPRVKLLATSQERLRLQEEWVVELAGLPVPQATATKNLESVSSIALFLQRARQVQQGFALTEAEGPSIARICQLVAGMPLGIELAATWVRVLPPAEIAQELERTLDFLITSARDLPTRHRSLRAVFDHSWNLLTEIERQVLRRLAVFRGGFTRDAAGIVCREPEIGNREQDGIEDLAAALSPVAYSLLPVLAALVDKSLLRRIAPMRYDMHDLVRRYAWAKLQGSPAELDAVQDRHSLYYTDLARQWGEHLTGARQWEAVAALVAEFENIRHGWSHALARGDLAAARKPLRCLWFFYEIRCLYQEAETTFGRAAAKLQASVPSKGAAALACAYMGAMQSWFCLRLGQFERARELVEPSLAVVRSFEAPAELADTLYYIEVLEWITGNYEKARAFCYEHLALAERIGDRWGHAVAFGNLGMNSQALGDYAAAREQMRQAIAMYRASGDRRMVAVGLNFLSAVECAVGNYDEAQLLLREGLALNTLTGERWTFGLALNQMGLVAMLQQEYQAAIYLFRESLNLFRELGEGWSIARGLNHLGAATRALGDDRAAERYFLEALVTARRANALPEVLDALVALAGLLASDGAAEQALALVAQVEQHPAASKEAQDRALQLRAELIAALSPPRSAAALERVGAMPLDAVVAEVLEGTRTQRWMGR
jgi:predicted ATPase/class 3 adenylate cyclase